MSVKIVNAFLCERVEPDGRGKHNAFGIGPQLFASKQYPTPPVILTYCMWIEADHSDLGTTHTIELEIRDEHGQADYKANAQMLIAQDILRTFQEIPIRISARSPGLKQFIAKIDGKYVVEIPIAFIEAKA